MFPNDDNVISCIVLTGHFCILHTTLHPVDESHDSSYFLFINNKKIFQEYCKISVANQTADHAISLDRNYWAITILVPKKLYIICLIYVSPHTLKHPLGIIYLL